MVAFGPAKKARFALAAAATTIYTTTTTTTATTTTTTTTATATTATATTGRALHFARISDRGPRVCSPRSESTLV